MNSRAHKSVQSHCFNHPVFLLYTKHSLSVSHGGYDNASSPRLSLTMAGPPQPIPSPDSTHGCIAALQKGLGVAQQEPMVRVHHVGLPLGQDGGLRLLVLPVFFVRAVERLLPAVLQEGLLQPRAQTVTESQRDGRGRSAECSTFLHAAQTHVHVGVEELRPGVAGEHVDDDHLTPLLHVNQQVAELAVVLVDEVYALWTYLLKCHHHTPSHQLSQGKGFK